MAEHHGWDEDGAEFGATHSTVRQDVSVLLGRPKKQMLGPNGLFREFKGAEPLPPNQAKVASTFVRHCTEDPRCYELKGMQKQAQTAKDSPGPMYNTRLEVEASSTIFTPRDVGKYPRYVKRRDDQGNLLPALYNAGGPKSVRENRTRPKKKTMSSQHPATDMMFPSRNPDVEKQAPGFPVGHISSFGNKAANVSGNRGDARVQSTFSSTPSVCFARPFHEIHQPGSFSSSNRKTPRREHPSPRLRKLIEVAGNQADEPPALTPRPKEEAWRINKLFPYKNA